MLFLAIWLIDNKLIVNVGTNKILLRVNELAAWTVPSLTTVAEEPLAILMRGYLFEKCNEVNLFLIPIIWEKAAESITP